MRKLGLDLGERRVGLAVTDPTGTLVTPLPPLIGYDREGLRAWVEDFAAREGVDEVVVGMPRLLSGEEGEQAVRAREMASALEGLPNIRVIFWDERLTTREARRRLREAGGAKSLKRKGEDSAAAALMLDSYLRFRSAGRCD